MFLRRTAKSASMPGAFCAAPNLPSFRSSNPPNSNSSSICKPQRSSACKSRPHSRPAPTRSSNDREDEAPRVHHAARRCSKGMEKTMRRFPLLLLVALLGGTDRVAAQETVETRGITSVIKMDEVIFGHLIELNGRFKLRATELTFAPDGYVGVHHHVGPGIRYVISGEVTFTQGGQETVYKAGEYYFETGNLTHTSRRIRQTCRLAC